MRVVVQTFDMKTGTLESERVIDHSVRDQRVWPGKHCMWAFSNGRGVQTFNEKDERK